MMKENVLAAWKKNCSIINFVVADYRDSKECLSLC